MGLSASCHDRSPAGSHPAVARLSRRCVASAGTSCSFSTTCTKSGSRRPSRWCAACSTRAARRSGWSRPDAAAPTSVLADLVAAGRCLEFGPADLAFSEAETRQVFVAMRQAVTPDGARAVLERTEGWPAGAYLAALAARRGRGRRPHCRPPGGHLRRRRLHRRLLQGRSAGGPALGRREVPAANRRPRPDVRTRCATPSSRRPDPRRDCRRQHDATSSSSRSDEPRRRTGGIATTGCSGRCCSRELRLREPGEEVRLHRRAAAWFEDEGLPDEAIPHALAGGDLLRAARLVDLRARQAFAAGRRSTVLGWLDQLDDAALAAYPPLAVTAGWIWALERASDPGAERSSCRPCRRPGRPPSRRQQLAGVGHRPARRLPRAAGR